MGKQNLITIQLLAITGILLSILVSMVAFRQFTLFQSKADLQTSAELEPPYLRLKQVPSTVSGQATVEVMLNTASLRSTGADIKISYNPQIVRLRADLLKSLGAFGVLSVTEDSPGLLDFTVFSSSTRPDESMVQTNADQEIAIASVTFDRVDPTAVLAELSLVFQPNSLSDSNVIVLQEPRGESPIDILKGVEGAIVSFTP